ncbi:MAG TPA: phosphatase PAP2 family protein [Pyrinomonadaceae bacterium]
MTTDDREAQETTGRADAPQSDPARQRDAQQLWRAETAYALGLLVFGALALFAHFRAYFDWDLRIERGLQSLNWPGLFDLMRAVSVFGNRWIPSALTAVTAIIFLIYHKRSEAAGLVASAGGSGLVNIVLKNIIGRPRPTAELVTVYRSLGTDSFPSGHVTFYVCYFGFLFFVAFALLPRGSKARRAALVLTALPVALIGLSRVYLGAHWPSDTLGAYLFSGLWLGLSLHLYRHWKQRATFHTQREQRAAKQ